MRFFLLPRRVTFTTVLIVLLLLGLVWMGYRLVRFTFWEALPMARISRAIAEIRDLEVAMTRIVADANARTCARSSMRKSSPGASPRG